MPFDKVSRRRAMKNRDWATKALISQVYKEKECIEVCKVSCNFTHWNITRANQHPDKPSPLLLSSCFKETIKGGMLKQ